MADLLSKHYIFKWLMDVAGQEYVLIPGYLKFNLRINPGAIWGIGEGQQTILLLVTALIIPAVALLAYSCKDKSAPLWSLGILLGGAAGNLYDRIFTSIQLDYMQQPVDGVRDFIDMAIPGIYDWPVYNIADIGIVAGVLIYAIWSLWFAPETSTSGKSPCQCDSASDPVSEESGAASGQSAGK